LNLFGGKDQALAWQVDFHCDSAPACDVLRVHKFLAKKSITKMDHSPDLAPCDGLFFPRLKYALKGQRIVGISDIHCNMTLL
jgi:hypothetical protein